MAVEVQVTLFNRFGRAIAEIEPAIEQVSWRLNNKGMARFILAATDSKCTRDNLAFGNRVLVEFDNGLPDWGGVIDPPRRRQPGDITVTAYTGEQLLDWRITARGRYFAAQTPGYIAQTLLEEENVERATGISVGSTIYTGGTARTIEYHYHDLLQRYIDLARLTGEDFAVLPVYSAGTLSFELNWYGARGSDLSDGVVLLESANLQSATMDEQGEIANRIVLVGEGTTWGVERLKAIDSDTTSQETYGYREYAEKQETVKYEATLVANAAALLAEKKDPANAFTLAVTDQAPGMFEDYDLGDVVRVMAFQNSDEWYFDGEVRVVAREWTPSDVCRLEVQEEQ